MNNNKLFFNIGLHVWFMNEMSAEMNVSITTHRAVPGQHVGRKTTHPSTCIALSRRDNMWVEKRHIPTPHRAVP